MPTGTNLAPEARPVKSALEIIGHTPEDYLTDQYVVLDLEIDTSHGDWGNAVHPNNGILVAAWKRGGDAQIHTHWGSEFDQRSLCDAIRASRFVVAHNLKYECGWLRRMGVELPKLVGYCTQIGEYILSNGIRRGLRLDDCAKRRNLVRKDPVVDRLIGAGINPIRIPRRWLEQRCRLDVHTTELVFLKQRAELLGSRRLPIAFTRCLLTPVLADIEAEGLYLNSERVATEFTAHVDRRVQLGAELETLTGGINPASSKQLGEFLYGPSGIGFAEPTDRRGNPKRTDTGKARTDAKTLGTLRPAEGPAGERQREFLAVHRELAKCTAALSKSLNFYDGICKHRDGIFYGQFNQTVTATGRLSASGIPTEWGSVQFQNQDRSFKRLFRARRGGWLIAEADGAQLEFRVAVDLGKDRQGIADVEDVNFDAHIVSASAMAKREYADMLADYRSGSERVKQLRQLAKPDTFKPLYGGSKGTPAQERWYAEFKRRYAGIAKAQENWVHEVLGSKRLVTDWGVIFEFPEAHMSSSGYVNVTSQVYNYPVQAFATAEIIPIAVSCFWRRVADEGLEQSIRCVNTVHDSVVVELHPDRRDDFIRLAKQAFTTDVYDYLREFYGKEMIVPLGVSVKIGEHWGEGKELAWDIYSDGREVDRTK